MASITKHKSGFRAQVYVKGARDSGIFRTKREAEAWAAARETELRTPQPVQLPGGQHTFGDALRKYSEEVTPGHRGRRWEEIRIAKFLRDPNLPCGEAVGKITTPHLSAWRDARLKEVSASSVLRELKLLAAVLEAARREWKWIAENPMRDVRKPRAPDHREILITRAQIRLMLGEMGYSPRLPVRTVGQAVAVCFLVALRTGMRAGELCGLTWDQVHDGYCSTPHKTGSTAASLRHVPLTGKATALMSKLRGWDDVLVFGLKSATLDALFRKYRQRAGIEGITFHDSRHTAATWMARKLDVLDLCKALGWSNPAMAMVYYNPHAADIARRMG